MAFPQTPLDLKAELQVTSQVSQIPMGVYRGPTGRNEQNGVVGTAGQGIAAYESWLGHGVQYALDYVINAPATTAAFTAAHLGTSGSAGTDSGISASAWTGHLGGRTLMLALPACIGVSAGAGATTWAQEAAGASDTYWTTLGNNLISWGLGSSVLRIGREFNGNWYNWSPLKTGDSAANFVAGWQHVVTLLRGLTGANFKFMWNPILDAPVQYLSNIQNYFPGKAYVDVIGLDEYDWGDYSTIAAPGPYNRSVSEQETNWSFLYSNTWGMSQWIGFARSVGLPLDWPEWGLQLWLQGSNYIGGSDDPYFVEQMASVLQTLSGEGLLNSASFWEDGDGVFDGDSGRAASLSPDNARSTFLELFGPATYAAGGWTDISSYVYQRNGAVTVTRGLPDEATATNPSQAALELNNRDGRFSSRYPAGAYYGSLGRNTPLRLSVPDQSSYLRLEDGGFCSTPSAAALNPAGDIEVQLDMKLSSNAFSWSLASKWTSNVSQSWDLVVGTDGRVSWFWSTSGTNSFAVTTTATLPLGRVALKMTFAVATGQATFYTAPSIAGPWTLLEAPAAAGSTSVFASTADIEIGSFNLGTDASPPGRIYGFRLLSGIGGTEVAYADFTSATAGAGSYTDAHGNVWTPQDGASFDDRKYRFNGEVASWPQMQDVTGKDVWAPIQANGLLRRLGQGTSPLNSVLTRYWSTLTGSLAPVAWWPCEDGNAATQIASGLAGGGQDMTITGSPTFASDSGFACAAAIPVINGSVWKGNIPKYHTSGTDLITRFLMHVPSGGEANNNARIVRLYTSGTVNECSLYYTTGGGLGLAGYSSSGATLFDTGPVSFGVNGQYLQVSVELRKSGSNISYSVVTLVPGATNGEVFSGTLTSATVGNALAVWVNPYGASGGLSGTALGQLTVQTTYDSLFNYGSQLQAYEGETAAARFYRLCLEEGVPCRIYGYPDLTRAMGPQGVKKLTDLLQECVDADRGMLFEPREALALGYRTRRSLENQSAAITLDYAAGDLGTDSSTSLQPVDDDQYTRNDVTVQRSNGTVTGTSSRQVLDSGTLSTASPPDGVGDYSTQLSVNLFLDSQVDDQAGWELHLGTVDEPRYPSIPLNLARGALSGSTSKYYGVQDVDQGDYVAVANGPFWLPPGNIKQLATGFTEKLGGFVFEIDWQCIPESPYETGVAGSGATSDNRADTDGSSLLYGVSSSVTSLSVVTSQPDDGSLYLWTTTAADFPFDIVVGGEQMTVTAITGTDSPQTFTVTRSVNGVVKSHVPGEAVTVYDGAVVALDDPY